MGELEGGGGIRGMVWGQRGGGGVVRRAFTPTNINKTSMFFLFFSLFLLFKGSVPPLHAFSLSLLPG